MADLGFEGLSMEPVVGDDLSYAITEKDLPRIFDEYDNLAEFYLKRLDEGRPFIYYHFIMDLYRGPVSPNASAAAAPATNTCVSSLTAISIPATSS